MYLFMNIHKNLKITRGEKRQEFLDQKFIFSGSFFIHYPPIFLLPLSLETDDENFPS